MRISEERRMAATVTSSGYCFRDVLPLMAPSAEAYTNLGTSLKGQGKLAEAADAYREALRLEPDRPEIAYNLGTTLHEHGALDQAIEYYRLALQLKANFPEASNNLATALKEQGLLEEAVAQFRATLTLQPDHVLAYYNLSELAAIGRYSFAADELARVKKMLACERSTAFERSLCGFTLASVSAKQGAYDEAFGYYEQANKLRKGLQQEHGPSFDAKLHQALVERIMASHDRAYFKRVEEWGTDTDLPVFIIGMPRSGSTLVEQILASHPLVFGAGELGEIPRFVARLAEQGAADLYASPVLSNPHATRTLARGYLEGMAKLGQTAERVTIKTLDNFLHLGVIATLFPRARIIHCRREPLDVCLSCYFQNFQDMPFAWDLEDIGAYYRSYERLMTHWASVLPTPIYEVTYEDLVHNQEKITRDLLAFCGLAWDERCMAFFDTRRVVRTASTVQVRKPISAQAIGRWKHYHDHLGPLFKALGQPFAAEWTALPFSPSEAGLDEGVQQRWHR